MNSKCLSQQEVLLYHPVSTTVRTLLSKDDTHAHPQKHRKHLENKARTAGSECSGRQKKENKASSWKNISGA